MLRLGRPDHLWVAKCRHCRRASRLSVDRIIRRYSEREPLPFVANRLKCGRRGKIGAETCLGGVAGAGLTCKTFRNRFAAMAMR